MREHVSKKTKINNAWETETLKKASFWKDVPAELKIIKGNSSCVRLFMRLFGVENYVNKERS